MNSRNVYHSMHLPLASLNCHMQLHNNYDMACCLQGACEASLVYCWPDTLPALLHSLLLGGSLDFLQPLLVTRVLGQLVCGIFGHHPPTVVLVIGNFYELPLNGKLPTLFKCPHGLASTTSASASTTVSSDLALNTAGSSLVLHLNEYGFLCRARISTFVVACSCSCRTSARNSKNFSSIWAWWLPSAVQSRMKTPVYLYRYTTICNFLLYTVGRAWTAPASYSEEFPIPSETRLNV